MQNPNLRFPHSEISSSRRSPRTSQTQRKYRKFLLRMGNDIGRVSLQRRLTCLKRYQSRLAIMGALSYLGADKDLLAQNQCTVASEVLVNQETSSFQANADVAMDADGNYVVVWQSSGNAEDPSDIGVFLRRYSAAGAPLSGDVLVNQETSSDQSNPSVAMDADGDFVVVWQSNGNVEDQSSYGVFMRRYSAAGVASNEVLVNQRTTFSQSNASVAMDDDGDFVVVWQSSGHPLDQSGLGVFARRYDATGAPLSNEFLVNQETFYNQLRADVGMDADGDFVVTWQSDGNNMEDPSLYGVFARIYDAAGAPSDEFLVNQQTLSNQRFASVAMDADGDFVVVWQSSGNMEDPSVFGVFARRYDAAGVPLADEVLVNQETASYQVLADVAMDANGDFAVVWQSYGNMEDQSIYGVFQRRYSAVGVPLTDELLVNQETSQNQFNAAVAMDPDGDFVVVWQSDGNTEDQSGWGIFQRRYFDCCTPAYSAAAGNQLMGTIMGDQAYQAASLIESVQQLDGGDIHYDAGECVELLQGFEVKGGTMFEVTMDGCQ